MNTKVPTIAIVAVATAAAVGGTYFGARYERAQMNRPEVQLKTAVAALKSGSDMAAVRLLTPLAAKGDTRAQYWLGDIYENGLGVKKDVARAIGLFEKAGGKGFRLAQARLGSIFFHGDEIVQDVAKARQWLRRAALAGDSLSALYLGQIYRDGLGIPKDPVESYAWFEVSTLLKNAEARAKALSDEMRKPETLDKKKAAPKS